MITTEYARDGLTLCCLGHDATEYDSRKDVSFRNHQWRCSIRSAIYDLFATGTTALYHLIKFNSSITRILHCLMEPQVPRKLSAPRRDNTLPASELRAPQQATNTLLPIWSSAVSYLIQSSRREAAELHSLKAALIFANNSIPYIAPNVRSHSQTWDLATPSTEDSVPDPCCWDLLPCLRVSFAHIFLHFL